VLDNDQSARAALLCTSRTGGESAPNLSCGKAALHYVKSALQFAICNSDSAAGFDAIRAQIIMVKTHALCTDIKRVCKQTHLAAVLHLCNEAYRMSVCMQCQGIYIQHIRCHILQLPARACKRNPKGFCFLLYLVLNLVLHILSHNSFLLLL
jgi:hypothetical protein